MTDAFSSPRRDPVAAQSSRPAASITVGHLLAEISQRQQAWTREHLGAVAPLMDLAIVTAIGSCMGFGAKLQVHHRQPAIGDLLRRSAMAVLPADAVQVINAADDNFPAAPVTAVCRLVYGRPCSTAMERQLRRLWDGESVPAPAPDGLRSAATQTVVWLDPLDHDGSPFVLPHATTVTEPAGESAIRAGMHLTECGFTSGGRQVMADWWDICSTLRQAMEQIGAVAVTLPSIEHRISSRLSPQAAGRFQQVMSTAATLAAIRTWRQGEITGTEADLTAAITLLRAAGAADDWPGTPEYMIYLGRLFASLPWGAGGWTFEDVQMALNGECLAALLDQRYWPPSGAPTGNWTYPTVRRRMEAMAQLGWLRRERRGATVYWLKTADMENLGGAQSFFEQIGEAFRANGSSFSAQAENTATGVGR